jgi:hypothetical protein
MATDLAKLSLWLATLARDHEFTFLDHALKSGDSLVGLTRAQIAAVHWDSSKPGLPLFKDLIRERFEAALTGRAEIRDAPDDVERAIQEARYQHIERRLSDARLLGDAVVAAFFSADKPRPREVKRQGVESWLNEPPAAMWVKIEGLASTLRQRDPPIPPFHWQLEFPEVFARRSSGFDAIIGNPPYLGATKISGTHSPSYFRWLATTVLSDGDKADLIAYFFRKIWSLLRDHGVLGIIATSSITEGDTRAASLTWARRNGGQIYRAHKKQLWPGEANVHISRLHVAKGFNVVPCILDEQVVTTINSLLEEGDADYTPARLHANEASCFEGFVPCGAGFLFDDNSSDASPTKRMTDLLKTEPQAHEVIYPYLGGEEVVDDPTITPSRYVIYVSQLSEEEVRTRYPNTYLLLKTKVKPYRETKSERVAKAPWWQFLWARPRLFAKMQHLSNLLVISRVSKHHAFVRVPSSVIPSTRLSVITREDFESFAILQSRTHEVWSRYFGASRGETFNYSPTDCFETFPFPEAFEPDLVLRDTGHAYDNHRATVMVGRCEGLTQTYNRFHDRRETAADIVRLRQLHAEMDQEVLRAYGWDDLAERAEPQFLDEMNEDDHKYQGRLFWPAEFRDEVLARLLALNAERAAAERENEPLAPRARAKRAAKGLAEAGLLESMAADEDDQRNAS